MYSFSYEATVDPHLCYTVTTLRQLLILYHYSAKYKTNMPNPDLPAGQLTQNMHLSEELDQPYEDSMRKTSSNSIQGMEKQSSVIMQIRKSNLD